MVFLEELKRKYAKDSISKIYTRVRVRMPDIYSPVQHE